MALFRRFFYRKPPDRLLEISERVYVFDCCFSTDVMEEDQYKLYLGGIVEQLQDYFPDSSFMVFNFREGDRRSQLSDILTQYDMTVMDYPRQYEGCPLLPLEMVHHFLRSSESWLSLEGQQNVLLMHCERGGWPVLAFMLAGLLLYRRQYSGEQKTLEMIYKQAPRELLHFLSTLNPYPSQLRYLQYISRRNFGIDWPPADTPLVLDCLMLRAMPVFEGGKGCRPVVRVYGQDPSKPANRTSKLLYSTSKTKKHIRQYVQEESMLVKVDLRCRVQGDVVIECINLDEDLQQEQMVFRLMFHTAFVRANILMLSRDDIDILWDAKDQFSRDFRAEVLFADADTILPPLTGEDLDDSESASPEEFYEVEEIFTVDAPESKGNFDSHKTKKASHVEYAEVVREEVDVHSFEDCRGDDVNHKQSRKLNSNVDAVKDIAVDDVKYRIDEKEVSDLEAVKDIAVDNGNIKFGPTSAISDVRINEETELITYEAAKEFKETEDKADRASSSNLKLDPSVLLQKLTAEFDREKPEKLEQPSPLWNFVAKTKPPESMLARQKKQGFMLGDNLRQIKPDSPPLWVLNNKGPASSPMNLPHPPSRYNSAPPDFPVPHVLEESTAGANVKLSSNADDQGQAASILVSPVSSGLPPPPPPPLHSLASAVLAPRSLIPPPPPPPPFMSSSQVKVEIVSQSAVPKSAPPPPPGTHFNTGHNNGMTLASPPPPSWKSLHVSTPTPPPLQSSYGSRITTSEPSIEPPSTQSLQLVRGTPRIPPPPPPPPYLPSRSATVPPPPPPPPPPPYFSSTSPPPPPFIQENVVRHIPPPPPPPPRVEQGDLTPPVFERVPLPPPPPQGAASLPPPPPPQPSTRASSPSPPPPPPPPPPTSAMYGVPPPPPPPSTMYGAPPPPQLVCKASPVPPPPPPTMGRFPPPPPPPPPSLSGVPLPPPPPPTMSRAPPPPPHPSMFGTPPPPPLPPPSMSGAPPPPPPPPPPSMSGAPPPPPPPPPSMSGVPPPPPPPPSMSGAPPPPPPPPFGGAPPPPPMPGAPPPPPMPGAPPPPPPPGGGRGPPPPPPPGGGRGPPPPPPPGGGGPGAPPPPPLGAKGGGRGRGRGMGAAAPRRSSLKPLHWSKVTRAIQGSLWEELQRHGETQIAPEFDVSEIETLFSAIVPKPADSGRAKKKSAGSKPEKVQLIDLRRANNTEIMLTKVKMPLPDMMAAILALDESVLDVDQVDNLIKFCPTKEEMEQLKNYTGDKDNLGRCEQYFLELMKVPRVESKLRVFSFKIQFNTQISEFKRSLTTVNSACDEVRNSVKLKEIMKKILYLGNTLNQGTARGAAVGFKLDSLLKLTDTRASTSKMTLMHYLCKVLAAKSPPLLDFHLDLVSLETATKIQLKSLAEEMQAIIKGLEKVKQENAASANDGPVSDVFRKALKNFISSAESEVASVTNLYSVVGRNADALALYFGEDPARYPFEQVTATLLNFVKLFRKAHDENVKQAEQDKKKAEKEAEMEKARTPKKAEKDAEMEKASTPKKSDT